MMYASLSLLSFLLGGLGRRIAGGALNQWAGLPGGVNGRVMGDTPARLIYAALIAVCASLALAPPLVNPVLLVAVWIGSTTGNFNSIGMGRGGHSFLRDWWGMTAHGAICATIVLAALSIFTTTVAPLPAYWWLAPLGFYYAAPAYELGWAITGRYGNSRLPRGLQTGSDLAELIWGGLCGLCVFNAFWL